MKRLLISLGIIGTFGWLLSIASAGNNDCKEVEFSNNVTACVNIEDAGTNRWELTTDIDGGTTPYLRCDILTTAGLKTISTCNGEFSYNGNAPRRMKLRIRYNNTAPIDREDKPNNSSERTYPQWIYDRWNEERNDDNITNNDNYDTDNFYVTASPSNPDEDEEIDITIRARDGSSTDEDYRGTIRFNVQRRNNSTDERVNASSSLYDLERTSYTFTSSDDGIHTFSDLLTFTSDNYDYKLLVYDDDNDDIDGYRIFDFGNGYDEDDDDEENNETDNFYIISSTSNPNMNQYVDLTVRARDGSSTDEGYRGTIRFNVERKSGSSRVTASSSYYTLSRTSYTFTSSDGGIHEFQDLIKFRNDSYDYRIKIYDSTNTITTYKYFYINEEDDDTDNYDADNFYVSTDDSTPNINQHVDLTIKARDGSSTDTSYRGSIEFEVYYRQIGYTTWNRTTSLSYYEMKYPYEDNGYNFSSYNNGQVTITDFIKFRREGYEYKIVVIDDNNDIEGYKIFTIDDDDTNNSNTDNFYITTDNSTPTTSQWIDLTIKAREGTYSNTSYRGTIQFEVYYKAPSSSTRVLTTSTTYYDINSSYNNGYTFTSSDNGQKTFNNILKLKKNNYSYKVVVYDEDDEDIDGYRIFNVGSTSSNDDIDGFTSNELDTVEAIYDAWDNMIINLKTTYYKLRTSTTWINMSNDLKDEMELILDNDNDKEYDDFNEFYNAFVDRYRYTVSIR